MIGFAREAPQMLQIKMLRARSELADSDLACALSMTGCKGHDQSEKV
ncbi:MAG: hypothetical protein HZB53_04690 [Chloroflexi bacterium]|nr:hypothetical protein [Chloroflexota bacterium]